MWKAQWLSWPRTTSTRCCVTSAFPMGVVTRVPRKRERAEASRQLRSRASAPSRTCNVLRKPDSISTWSNRLTSKSCKRFLTSQSPSLSRGYFTKDATRFLVVAQPFESRVTKKAVIRPLSKTDLRHQLWFKPTQLFHFFGGDAFAEMAGAAGRQIAKWAFTR